jgi:hypothetical protein
MKSKEYTTSAAYQFFRRKNVVSIHRIHVEKVEGGQSYRTSLSPLNTKSLEASFEAIAVYE